MFDTADAFIGEIDGNTQPGLFDEEPLDLIQCLGMARIGVFER